DLGKPIERLRVDGGAASNNLLLENQAALGQLRVERPSELESTARGAAMLAALGAGLFSSGSEASRMIRLDRVFDSKLDETERVARLARWSDAVRRARSDGN